jgi:hypothetical protein
MTVTQTHQHHQPGKDFEKNNFFELSLLKWLVALALKKGKGCYFYTFYILEMKI